MREKRILHSAEIQIKVCDYEGQPIGDSDKIERALKGILKTSGEYSRARIEASLTRAPSDGLFGIASRDVRSLLAAIGLISGQAYWTLVVLAVLSGGTIGWRLLYLRVSSGRGSFPSQR